MYSRSGWWFLRSVVDHMDNCLRYGCFSVSPSDDTAYDTMRGRLKKRQRVQMVTSWEAGPLLTTTT